MNGVTSCGWIRPTRSQQIRTGSGEPVSDGAVRDSRRPQAVSLDMVHLPAVRRAWVQRHVTLVRALCGVTLARLIARHGYNRLGAALDDTDAAGAQGCQTAERKKGSRIRLGSPRPERDLSSRGGHLADLAPSGTKAQDWHSSRRSGMGRSPMVRDIRPAGDPDIRKRLHVFHELPQSRRPSGPSGHAAMQANTFLHQEIAPLR